MFPLLPFAHHVRVPQPKCNGGATPQARPGRRACGAFLVTLLAATLISSAVCAQGGEPPVGKKGEPKGSGSATATTLTFFAGAATGLFAHEGSHVIFDVAFGSTPGIKGVDFHGIPFFAITHTEVSRREEFVISSAGFWTQQAIDEWLLTTRRHLKDERAPFAKGLLAFGVGASVAYSTAAFARTGPTERDTRGMAVSYGPRGIDERWIGALVLAPAVLDSVRYFAPDRKWPIWSSRGVKILMLVMTLR
jgi:hypothetical protein